MYAPIKPVSWDVVVDAYKAKVPTLQLSDLDKIRHPRALNPGAYFNWPLPVDYGVILLDALNNSEYKYSPGTIHKIMKLARRIDNWQNNRTATDQTVKWPRVAAPKSKIRYLSEREQKAIHYHLSNRVENTIGNGDREKEEYARLLLILYDLLLYTGGRLSEILSLNRQDFFLLTKNESVTIVHPKTNTVSKVGLNQTLITDIGRLGVLLVHYVKALPSEKTPFFKPYWRGRLVSDLRKVINFFCNSDPETIKLSGRATIHSLRHTFATDALARNVELAVVAYALGHTNIKQTMMYAHINEQQELARRAVKSLWKE